MKEKYDGTLFVCDMDGTLLDAKHQIRRDKIDAICRFVDSGGLFSLATGRSVHSVKLYSGLLKINCPAILYNGAMIYDLEKDLCLYENHLNDDVEKTIVSLMERFPGVGISLFHGDNIYFVQKSPQLMEHAQREKYTPVICEPKDVPKPWTKVLMAWDPLRLPEVERFLLEIDNSCRYVYSETNFLEILNKNVSKGSALKELAKMTGISLDNVIAAGDNLNDMELITFAGLGIAVSNAHPDLKAAADFCCRSNNENVILDCIERYDHIHTI